MLETKRDPYDPEDGSGPDDDLKQVEEQPDYGAAERNMKDLPWPEIGGRAVDVYIDRDIIVWDAVEGSLSGPDERHPGFEISAGMKFTLRVFPNFGTISINGRVVGKY